MLISPMDGSLVWSNRYHQSGTLMPSGAVHPIIPGRALARTRNLFVRSSRDSGFSRVGCPGMTPVTLPPGKTGRFLFRLVIQLPRRRFPLGLAVMAAGETQT